MPNMAASLPLATRDASSIFTVNMSNQSSYSHVLAPDGRWISSAVSSTSSTPGNYQSVVRVRFSDSTPNLPIYLYNETAISDTLRFRPRMLIWCHPSPSKSILFRISLICPALFLSVSNIRLPTCKYTALRYVQDHVPLVCCSYNYMMH